jgi:integrase
MAEALKLWPRLGEYVIGRTDGRPYGPRWVNLNWNKTIANLEMRKLGFVPHSLRHFVNSWLLNQGFPPQHVRSYLGWSEDSDNPQARVTRVQKGYLQISIEEIRPMVVSLSDALLVSSD